MSRQINQPINQVRLTNVAVVRVNRGGKRFEIACYKNKVVDYRQGLEKDLSEVLQTDRIFTNVSKGEFAKAKDLQKVFGTKDEEEIATQILAKGQVQVSDKERSLQLDKTTAQIAEWISKNCVQLDSDRPYTIPQVRHAMQQANFSVHPTKPLKRQYLDCVKLLQEVIPIQRARMELLLRIPNESENTVAVEASLRENNVTWTAPEGQEDTSDPKNYRIKVDPSLYRVLNELIQDMAGARIEILTQVVTRQTDEDLEIAAGMGSAPPQMNAAPSHTSPDPAVDSMGTALEAVQITPATTSNGVSNLNLNDYDSDNEIGGNRRKQQKKSKKKMRKNQRRNDTTSASSSDAAAPNVAEACIPVPAAGSTNVPSTAGDANSSRKGCNTCGGAFDTPAAYRAHFRSDWHRFNQKLKMKGVAPISELEFNQCDADSFFGGIGNDDLL